MTNTTAKITWIPAVGSKPNSILKFLVETSPEGLKWTTVATLAPTVKTYTLNRLKTPQLVRVRAVNNIGPGIPTLGVRIPGTVATVANATGAVLVNPKPTPTPAPKISGAPKVVPKK
ncbi:MAG: fibronectin type III domain-containing protein [Mariniphaga sp.]